MRKTGGRNITFAAKVKLDILVSLLLEEGKNHEDNGGI